MLQDLRRFQMFDSSATRPYTVSAMACWKRAADLGYITLDTHNKVRLPAGPDLLCCACGHQPHVLARRYAVDFSPHVLMHCAVHLKHLPAWLQFSMLCI